MCKKALFKFLLSLLMNGFREKVLVPATKPYITFQGAGRDVTTVEWHDRASDRGPNGQQLRTYNSASVTVLANYFIARNISFKVCFQCTISHLARPIWCSTPRQKSE